MGSERRVLLFARPSDSSTLIGKHLGSNGCQLIIQDRISAVNLTEQLEERPDLGVIISEDDNLKHGMELLASIRSQKSSLPLIHLINNNHFRQRVISLKAGSDDVLSFPFALEELDARIEALIRRVGMETDHREGALRKHADLELNTETREVNRAGIIKKLTVKEFDLMIYFLQHPGQALPRKAILHAVWGQSWTGDDNLLEVYIRYLRKKIERPGHDKLLQTVRGVGYLLK